MAEEVIKIVGVADMTSLNKGLDNSKGKLDTFGKSVQNTSSGLKAAVPGTNQAAFALTNLGRVAQDAPFGFIGIQNNINPLLESFQRLKLETGSTGGALKALAGSLTGAAGIGLAVSVVTGLLTVFAQNGLFKSGKEADDASKKLEKYKEAVSSIFTSAGKEAAETLSLVAVLKNENETRQRKLQSLEELKKINPIIFGQLKLEQGAVIGLDTAYKDYIANFKNIIAAKILQAKIETKVNEILQKQGITQSKLAQNFKAGLKEQLLKSAAAGSLAAQQQLDELALSERKTAKETSFLSFELENLIEQLSVFSSAVKTKPIKEIKAKKIKIKPAFKVKLDPVGFDEKNVIFPEQSFEELLAASIAKNNLTKNGSFLIQIPIDVEADSKESFKGLATSLTELDEIRKIAYLKSVGVYKGIQDGLKIGVEGLRGPQLDALYNSTLASITSNTAKLQEFAANAFTSLADAIGNSLAAAFSGQSIGNIFGNLFGTILESLGRGIRQLGIEAIAASKLILAIRASLGTPQGIVAGIGLIALGTIITSIAAKLKAPKFATGTRNFSGGTAIVGERGPELIGLPRGASVTPNAQSNAILNGASGSGFVASYVLRGQDLITVINRTTQSNNRAGFN